MKKPNHHACDQREGLYKEKQRALLKFCLLIRVIFNPDVAIMTSQPILYNYNDNLATIFKAKLKAAIDDQEPQKSPIFKDCFQPPCTWLSMNKAFNSASKIAAKLSYGIFI